MKSLSKYFLSKSLKLKRIFQMTKLHSTNSSQLATLKEKYFRKNRLI